MTILNEQIDLAESKTSTSKNAMVVTAFPAASAAGEEILRAGGNAVDAAVAAAWALAVCEPSGSGLGGQTILLLRLHDGQTLVVDGHSHAPAAVSLDAVSSDQQKHGYRACTVPSTPATLEFVRQRYGTLPLARVLEPAIRLAEEGFSVTALHHRQLKWCLASLQASPSASELLLNSGQPYEVGELFRQPQLAATLRRIARCGTDDFYHGDIARSIADDMQRHGGLLTEEDLAACETPDGREPLSIRYGDYEISSPAPPAGGLQVLLAMKVLEKLEIDRHDFDADQWYELLAEVTHVVFHEREHSPIRPSQLVPSLTQWLLSDRRAAAIADDISRHVCDSLVVNADEEEGETTHLCTADGQGNVVSLTQSIQSLFGARVANAKCGFLYNNYLITCPREPHPYQLGSRCLPRSNAAPTLVLRAGENGKAAAHDSRSSAAKPVLALGSAGSRRITSSILHVLSGVLDRGLSLTEAIAAPRIHAKLSRNVWLERPAATALLMRRLEMRFRRIDFKSPHSYSMGAVQAIAFAPDGTLAGAADPRREGSAIGI
jgi:gamma-glutamyltranspeptidase/glutathione hydrolase